MGNDVSDRTIMTLMISVRPSLRPRAGRTANPAPLDLSNLRRTSGGGSDPPLGQNRSKSLRFALILSADVQGLHVDCGEGSQRLRENWSRYVEKPTKESRLPTPKLVVLESPYRFIINPILTTYWSLRKNNPDREIAVLVPELVVQRGIITCCIISARHG